MKIRIASQLPVVKIGSSSLTGKELTSFADNMGYAAYELLLDAGNEQQLSSPFGQDFNHIYYCFDGSGEAQLQGSNRVFAKDVFIALTGKMEMKVTASSRMRILAAYVQADPEAAAPKGPLIRTLAELVGGERDILWGNGHSRRFLIKSDNFNIGLTNTLGNPGTVSNLEYKNNYEVCYYVRGDITYKWTEGNKEESRSLKQDSTSDGDGIMYIMDKHDAHAMCCGTTECECLCLFYPPLKGTEAHSLSGGGHSSY